MTEYTLSNRQYTNVETGETYSMLTHDTNHRHVLMDSNKNLLKSFYCCAVDSVTIRLNTKEEISMGMGDCFINTPERYAKGRKFAGFTKFQRL